MDAPIKLYCKKCEEMTPILLRFNRQSFQRSRSVIADCTACGSMVRTMNILDAINLGATLESIVTQKAPKRRKKLLVQETIPGTEAPKPKRQKEKPQWLKDKIAKSYADKARKAKRSQGNLF